MHPYETEPLGPHIRICVTKEHKFGTDAFLLASFAAPRRKDICCDLGTGCGIIPLYWANRFQPKRVYAVDVMAGAIDQLNASLELSQVESEILPIHKDLNALEDEIPWGQVDLVTCNPPYKLEGTGLLSETAADQAARHETLCTIGDICRVSGRLLRYGGRFCVCQRPERLLDVMDAMREAKIEPKRLRFVHQRPNTPPWLFLLEGRRGGGPYMTVEKPLFIEGEVGFSREMLDIYGKEENL